MDGLTTYNKTVGRCEQPGSFFQRIVRLMRTLPVCALAVCMLALAGCEQGWWNGFLDPSQVGRFGSAPRKREIRRTLSLQMDESDGVPNASEPTRDDTNVRFAEAELEPGDALEIGIFELLRAEDEYRVRRVVNETGYLGSIPEVGTLKVVGLTPRGLELELSARLQASGKLVTPQVSVTVLESQSKRYTVLGSVSRPGTYAIPRPNFRVIDAIADAGGVPPEIKTIYVMRTTGPKPQMSKEADALYQPGTPGIDAAPQPFPTPAPVDGGNEAFKLSDMPATHGQFAAGGMKRRGGLQNPPGTSRLYSAAPVALKQTDPTASATAATQSSRPASAPTTSAIPGKTANATAGVSQAPSTAAPPPPTAPPTGNDQDIPNIQPLLPPPAATPPQPTIEELNDLPATAAPSRPWAYDSARGWYEDKSAPMPNQGGAQAQGGAPTQGGTQSQGGAPSQGGMPVQQPTSRATGGATASSAASQGGVDWSQVVEGETTTRIIAIPTEPLMNGDARYNIVLRPNDVLNVAPGPIGEFYVMGNVLRPGAYSLTGRDVDVRAAIAAAGGFGPLATPSRAELIRRGAGDQEEIRSVDLDAIFSGRADNFFIKPNDILNVGTNALMPFIATVRNAFRVSYGFGFVYDRNFADIDGFTQQQNPNDRRRIERQQLGFPFPG